MPRCICVTKASRPPLTPSDSGRNNMRSRAIIVSLLTLLGCAAASADDGQNLLSVDHYVRVRSTVPAIAGQSTEIYVREVVRAGGALRAAATADRVVLFV